MEQESKTMLAKTLILTASTIRTQVSYNATKSINNIFRAIPLSAWLIDRIKVVGLTWHRTGQFETFFPASVLAWY